MMDRMRSVSTAGSSASAGISSGCPAEEKRCFFWSNWKKSLPFRGLWQGPQKIQVRRIEQGYLGSVVTSDDGWVYVNRVGTFGVYPLVAGRLSGALIRLSHHLLGLEIPIELLLYADDLEGLGLGPEGRKGLVLTYVYLASLGAPFKWSKQRGLITEWIGLTTDYGSFQFGLSEKRAGWLSGWIEELCHRKEVDPRLSFSTTALPWEKPFLARGVRLQETRREESSFPGPF